MSSAEVLIAELRALGINFVIGETSPFPPKSRLSREDLLAGLARHSDARLRLALVALFLHRPELAKSTSGALEQLDTADQTTLKLFYTAAVFLQRLHNPRLRTFVPQWQLLPDYFSEDLGIPLKESFQERLRILSKRHRDFTGLAANWLGSYQYAAKRTITRLEKEASWAA